MKKNLLFVSALAVLGLTACEKGLVDDIGNVGNGQMTNSVMQIRTRGAVDNGETVAYPVAVYVFQGDECKVVQTIGDEGQTLNIPLSDGTYSVCAVGGVSASDYVLPMVADALTTSAITLREGKGLTDLMAASATVTLVDGGTNTVTLGMARKKMLIQGVTIRNVPTAATAVTVTIAPLWQSLTIGGTYSTTNGSSTIALTRQEDGRTWKNGTGAYLLPPCTQPASISVSITPGGATKTYTYSTCDELEGGYRINIDGTYTETVGVTLSGTVTGATWLGERTISFSFDENGSAASGNGDNHDGLGRFPVAGDAYQGCYVLASTVADDGESAELTLLSPNEKKRTGNTSMTLATLQTEAAQQGTDDISDWRPMTRSEARLLQIVHSVLGISNEDYYLINDNGVVKQMDMANGNVSYPTVSEAVIRPVAIVSISKD